MSSAVEQLRADLKSDRLPVNPALAKHAYERAQSVENRIADRITAFSGSMRFVSSTRSGSAAGLGSGSRSIPMGS
jgi:hypothetical protein